jgi:endonuclease/exonuclease/phosphatase family metal-dependent hydrolase
MRVLVRCDTSRGDTVDSPPLTVVSFNIRNGVAFDGLDSWPFRRRATAQALARLTADLLGLQEVYAFQERYLVHSLQSFAATGAGRSARGGGERCSVLHRQARLRLEASRTRWLSDTPDMPGSRTWGNPLPRVVTLCRFVDEASGRRFAFADLHLDGASAASRERAAEALLGWLDPDLPWLVTGDLNETPDGAAVRLFAAAGLRDLIAEQQATSVEREDSAAEWPANVVAHDVAGGEPTRAEQVATEQGFGRIAAGRRIDYVLASGHWRLDHAWVARHRPGGRFPSDHWPVAARLSLR